MNKNELCFVNLLACFLNGKASNTSCDDWDEIYKLSEINNVTGIVASVAKKLPKDVQPAGIVKSFFNQTIGLTIVNFDSKQKAQDELVEFLSDNNIDYAFVKGAAIRQYYPAPELRTSGDIDVIVRPSKYNEIAKAFKNSNFNIEQANPNVIVLWIDDLEVEIHNGADVLGNYFANSFFNRCSVEGNKYTLNQYDQLLYVILHMAKHLKDRGAGIRMLMDMDVCIRAIDDFDEKKLLQMCADAGVGECAKTLLSLINYWFSTPVSDYIDIANKPELIDLLSKSFLHGGVFGFKNNDLGSHYVAQATGGDSVTVFTKIKSLFKLIFPSSATIKNSYMYVHKHPILLPIGYINRFIDGVFKRGKHSLNTAKQIVSSDDSVLIENQILSELELI